MSEISHIRFKHPVGGKLDWHGKGEVDIVGDFLVFKADPGADTERVVPMSNVASLTQAAPKEKTKTEPER